MLLIFFSQIVEKQKQINIYDERQKRHKIFTQFILVIIIFSFTKLIKKSKLRKEKLIFLLLHPFSFLRKWHKKLNLSKIDDCERNT
jgi:hypothetical protein